MKRTLVPSGCQVACLMAGDTQTSRGPSLPGRALCPWTTPSPHDETLCFLTVHSLRKPCRSIWDSLLAKVLASPLCEFS